MVLRAAEVRLRLISSSQTLNILLIASEEEHVLYSFALFDLAQCIIRGWAVIDLCILECLAISTQCNVLSACYCCHCLETVLKTGIRECWYCYQRGSHRLNGFIFTLVIRPLSEECTSRNYPRLWKTKV